MYDSSSHPFHTSESALGEGYTQYLSFINDLFLTDIEEFSSDLHIFRARDFNHHLACEMTLEVRESFAYSERERETMRLVPVVFCNLPGINTQRLEEKVDQDLFLQRILRTQFHLRVLEQLFLFCEEKEAANLVITLHEESIDSLDSFRPFLFAEEQVLTPQGELTQIVIPTDPQTYDKIIDLMSKAGRDFRAALWRDQSKNPVFRDYLKSHSMLAI